MKAFCSLLLVGLLLASCGGKQTLADVAMEDSLCIDTVAALDDVVLAPDTLAEDTLSLIPEPGLPPKSSLPQKPDITPDSSLTPSPSLTPRGECNEGGEGDEGY